MPEHLLRLKQYFHGSRDVGGRSGLNQWKHPMFVLHCDRKTDIGAYPVIPSRTHIRNRAASRYKLLTDFLMPEIELQAVARTEPVIRPSLRALSAAADPAANQIAVVGITIPPSTVGIKYAGSNGASTSGNIGVNSLHPQVQLWKKRKVGEVKARLPCGPVHISDGRELIVGISLAVKCHPIPQ